MLRTLPGIPRTRSRPGILRLRSTTCPSSTSRSAGNTTIAMPACRTGRAAGGITPPGSGGVPYTNNGYPQFFACNNGNSSMQETLSAAETACGGAGQQRMVPRSAPGRAVHRHGHHGQVLVKSLREEILVREITRRESEQCDSDGDWKEFAMQDVIFLAVTILFFVISLAYVHFCERVR